MSSFAQRDTRAIVWRDRLRPLADVFVERTIAFLPRAVHPARVGAHPNSAFATMLMLDYADAVGDAAFDEVLRARALDWYAADRDYPVAYETASEDFLSNGLLEAALIHRVLDDRAGFGRWWDGFVPDVARVAPWLRPIVPSDRSDARLTHIDGLNLSRAWCWKRIVGDLPDALQPAVRDAIDAHVDVSLPHAAEGHYVGTHWLASFALLALDDPRR